MKYIFYLYWNIITFLSAFFNYQKRNISLLPCERPCDIIISVTSNRESGFGRYDVMLEPKNIKDTVYILEFKVHDPEDEDTLADTVASALAQIEEKGYAMFLLAKENPCRIEKFLSKFSFFRPKNPCIIRGSCVYYR